MKNQFQNARKTHSRGPENVELSDSMLLDYIYGLLTDAETTWVRHQLAQSPTQYARYEQLNNTHQRFVQQLQDELTQLHPSAQARYATIAPQVARRRFPFFFNKIRWVEYGLGLTATLVMAAFSALLLQSLNPVVTPGSQPTVTATKNAQVNPPTSTGETATGETVTNEGQLMAEFLAFDAGNRVYRGIYDIPIRLTDGAFSGQPYVAGSAERPTVKLTEVTTVGDIDSDGKIDAALILEKDQGQNQSMFYIAVLMGQANHPATGQSTLIDNGHQIESVNIEDSHIYIVAELQLREKGGCCSGKYTLLYAVDERLTLVERYKISE